MARKGFTGNRKVIGDILKSPEVGAALDEIAGPVASRSGGVIDAYTTDRQVRAINVGAEEQAIDGVATKAIAEVQGQARGFRSRAQWRRAFAVKVSGASDMAHATDGGYAGLPEKAGR